MNTLFQNKVASSALTRATLLGLVGALLMTGFVTVYTNVSATSLGSGDDKISLAFNTFVNDTEVTVENSSISVVTSGASAAGESSPGVEAGVATFPAVNNTLIVDNYSYSFDVRESAANDWLVGEDLRIRVYGYDASGPTSTLLGTFYTKQVTADAGTEGVRVTVDLGSATSIPDHFDIIIERQ